MCKQIEKFFVDGIGYHQQNMPAGKSAQKRCYKLSDGTDMEEYRENPVWDFSYKYLPKNDIVLIASLMQNINVTTLNLSRCGITDISALKDSMPNITIMDLEYNQIQDISVLKDNMPNVTRLNLSWNKIVDISPLKKSIFRKSSMPNVSELNLGGNNIKNVDISVLKKSMPNVTSLTLSRNSMKQKDIKKLMQLYKNDTINFLDNKLIEFRW